MDQEQQQLTYKAVIDGANMLVCSSDDKQHVIFANEAFRKTIRDIYSTDAQPGMNFIDFINSEIDREIFKDSFDTALKGQIVKRGDFFGNEDMARHYFETVYCPMRDENNKICGVTFTAIDITENSKDLDLDDDLMFMIMHDLKSPLSGVISVIDILLDGTIGAISDEQREYVNLARVGTIKMTAMISDFIDAKKLEKGRLILDYKLFPAENLTKKISWVTDKAKREEKIIDISIDKNITVFADEQIMSRVIINLLYHGLRYAKHLELHIKKEGDMALIEVVDSSGSFPINILERIYEDFIEGSSKSSKAKATSDIGLVFCQTAIKAHGSILKVETSANKKSMFSFYLSSCDQKKCA